MSSNGFNVYVAKDKNGSVIYVGTTIQKPSDRWRWHKHNGKNFNFSLVKSCETADEMLTLEKELIDLHKPKFNKIKHRKQNLNKKLSESELQQRVGDNCWCQSCLKRRVNPGYTNCMYCGA